MFAPEILTFALNLRNSAQQQQQQQKTLSRATDSLCSFVAIMSRTCVRPPQELPSETTVLQTWLQSGVTGAAEVKCLAQGPLNHTSAEPGESAASFSFLCLHSPSLPPCLSELTISFTSKAWPYFDISPSDCVLFSFLRELL